MREAWWSRTGLTLELAYSTYSRQELIDALTYWRVEGEEKQAAQGGKAGGQQSRAQTQSAFEHLRSQKKPRGATPDGRQGTDRPADARGHR